METDFSLPNLPVGRQGREGARTQRRKQNADKKAIKNSRQQLSLKYRLHELAI